MGWKKLFRVLAAVLSFGLIGALPAAATDLHRTAPPAGWGQERVINHYVYYPRYHHVYRVHGATDPYAYRPADRGYYPYYNSGYWRPAHEMRNRHKPHLELPKYYKAWGYTKHWHHKQWHNEHHGHHLPWHW
jgi:hypothetical protein